MSWLAVLCCALGACALCALLVLVIGLYLYYSMARMVLNLGALRPRSPAPRRHFGVKSWR